MDKETLSLLVDKLTVQEPLPEPPCQTSKPKKPNLVMISIRLEQTTVQGFKTLAERYGFNYQTLMREALRHYLQRLEPNPKELQMINAKYLLNLAKQSKYVSYTPGSLTLATPKGFWSLYKCWVSQKFYLRIGSANLECVPVGDQDLIELVYFNCADPVGNSLPAQDFATYSGWENPKTLTRDITDAHNITFNVYNSRRGGRLLHKSVTAKLLPIGYATTFGGRAYHLTNSALFPTEVRMYLSDTLDRCYESKLSDLVYRSSFLPRQVISYGQAVFEFLVDDKNQQLNVFCEGAKLGALPVPEGREGLSVNARLSIVTEGLMKLADDLSHKGTQAAQELQELVLRDLERCAYISDTPVRPFMA